MTRRRLGEMLQAEGLLTDAQLRAGLEEQRKSNLFLGEALVKLGFVSEEVIAQTIVKQFGLPFISAQNYSIPLDVLNVFPEQMYYEYQFIALDKIAKTMVIVGAGLINYDMLDELERMSGCKICQYVSTWKDVRATLEKYAKDLKKAQQDLSALGSMLLENTPEPTPRPSALGVATTPSPTTGPFAPAKQPAAPAPPPAPVQLPRGLIVAAANTTPPPGVAAGSPPAPVQLSPGLIIAGASTTPASASASRSAGLSPVTPDPGSRAPSASGPNPGLKPTGSGIARLSAFAVPRPSGRTSNPGVAAVVSNAGAAGSGQHPAIPPQQAATPAAGPGAVASPAPAAPPPPPASTPADPPQPGQKTGLLGLFKNPTRTVKTTPNP